jgi:CRP/FNR family cyclic AMP-dependent transcriptional regulator
MPEILDHLQNCEERRFAAGEVVLEDGGSDGPLLFLAEGTVEVVMDGVQIATTSQRGTVFGVFSLLPNCRHAAMIRALQPCAFRVVDDPRTFLPKSPLVCWHVCETVTHRLAALSAYLCDAQRQFAGSDHLGMMRDVLATLLHRQASTRIRPSESTIREGEVVD